MKPDLAYVVKDDLDNEALRYSLRSIHHHAQGMFGNVWIVGDVLPAWLAGVKRISAPFAGEKFVDMRNKLSLIAACDEITDRVVVMHDDHFLMEPLAEWRNYHRGPFRAFYEHQRQYVPDGLVTLTNGWLRAVTATAVWWRHMGHGDVLTFQTHRPLVYDRQRMFTALEEYPEGRVLDGDGLAVVAGAAPTTLTDDCKVFSDPKVFDRMIRERSTPWLSSSPEAFDMGLMGGYIRGVFREPSPWEVD